MCEVWENVGRRWEVGAASRRIPFSIAIDVGWKWEGMDGCLLLSWRFDGRRTKTWLCFSGFTSLLPNIILLFHFLCFLLFLYYQFLEIVIYDNYQFLLIFYLLCKSLGIWKKMTQQRRWKRPQRSTRETSIELCWGN